MKINRLSCVILSFFSLFFFGCMKDNGFTMTYQLGVGFHESVITYPTPPVDTPWSIIKFTSGYASVIGIAFEKDSLTVYNKEIHKKVNLFEYVPLDLASITLPEGEYNGAIFRTIVQSNLTEAAVLLHGNYTHNNITTPFIFRVDSIFHIEARAGSMGIFGNGRRNTMTVLDLSHLSKNISEALMNSATLDNGTINISANSNIEIYNRMFDNLKTCAEQQ